eukprot:gene7355-7566_t
MAADAASDVLAVAFRLFSDPAYHDIEFVCTNDATVTTNRAFVCAANPFFHKLLRSGYSESQGSYSVRLHAEPEALKSILHFLYLGKLPADLCSWSTLMDTACLAHQYMLPAVIDIITKKVEAEVTRDDFGVVLSKALQRETVDTYLTEDVKFKHFLGDVQGRDAIYGVYRAAATGIDYKLLFVEMVIDDHMAAVWVDLNLKLAPFFLKRYHAPTIVMLRFRRCSDGLVRICEQIDHHSLFVFMWALGQPFSGVWDHVLRKVQGQVLSASGYVADFAADALSATWEIYRNALAWGVTAITPQPVLHALPEFLLKGLRLERQSTADGAEEVMKGAASETGMQEVGHRLKSMWQVASDSEKAAYESRLASTENAITHTRAEAYQWGKASQQSW